MKKLLETYGKKKVMLITGCITLAMLVGLGVWYVNEQNHKKEILDSINLTFKEDAFIEYGQEKVDFDEFINEKIGEPEVTLPTDGIDTKVLETKELTYKVSREGYSKDVTFTIEIKDTQAPEIVIKEETFTLAYGSEYDVKENIESVNDPVDGEVPYVEEAGENNYYIVEGSVDTSVPGDYTITIKAVDKNGVEATKEYTVHVNEEVQEETQTAGNNNYTRPGGGGTSGNGGSAQGNSGVSGNGGGSGNTCTFTHYANLGNSGKTFPSMAAANQWAKEERRKEGGPWSYDNGFIGNHAWTVRDNCGKEHNGDDLPEVWTVHFY